MKHRSILLLCGALFLLALRSQSQVQACPPNINFASGDLSFWSARSGLTSGAGQNYPAPNNGLAIVPEYTISTTGIQVFTPGNNTFDQYGGFETIPTINGYAYNYSVKIGSTATSFDLQNSGPNPGGFTRSVTYTINVPAGSTAVPYTMTYAYAMVLENGTHNSNEQPLFKATLKTNDSVINCASPKYYLPTFNNTTNNGSGATLDTATALANGFTNSPVAFLSHAGSAQGQWLNDVWTKGWTEVTFDLSPYRGQQVTLTFESDNCVPGAHFAYAYVAIRNLCAGLQISGDPVTCANSNVTYSVPSLANGSYAWQVPSGWTINSGSNSNIINVTAGSGSGYIIAHEVNGCANLRDTIFVTAKPPTVAGSVISNTTVCVGTNSTPLNLSGQMGDVLKWLYSVDGTSWTPISNTNPNYTATNLTTTTRYKAVVQNGPGCTIDTSAAAIISVDPKSKGGNLSPNSSFFCVGQNTGSQLSLTGNIGSVMNWQVSTDSLNWNTISPANTSSNYNVSGINSTTYYRTIVKNGVCPADTSAVAALHYLNTPFPQASIDPDATICYAASTPLNANITIGTSYTWTPSNTLSNAGNGTISSLPYTINATASPLQSTSYVLTVANAGCPNVLKDTFRLTVMPKILVNAGRDTAVISGQQVPFHLTVNDPTVNQYVWTPGTGLNSTSIQNPVALLTSSMGNAVTYIVKATNTIGCTGQDTITVRIFQTGADIFVPTAFTPNGDGKNDLARPIPVGIRQLNYFRIYNRWGELVYESTDTELGWNGVYKGKPQPSGTFVFITEGVDFTGQRIFRKGTITLIR